MKKRRVQYVLSAPGRIIAEVYTTPSGQMKNRYKKNPDARIIKGILHTLPHF